MASISIAQATTSADLASIAKCFRAYTEWLDLDLTFQNFATELHDLPGKYAPPTGALLLARDCQTDEVLGCIGLRPLDFQQEYRARYPGGVRYCEVKRLFVYPAARGRRVARALVAEALKIAEAEGYGEVLLDTLATMKPAIALYKSEGFIEAEPYYFSPLDGTVYMSKRIGGQNLK
ncbi:acyl-CoA N-acyltransferase [Dactylonectria estremocensis]|uniref:Acyl-CoA N-acyltransferase n=1 Tax=Dactylonectria estremocensis TaxID=1079267 RepID=A0A9P9FDH5_9HYPO|nr:acyl-CoA N-acyltransferase [Dactylonectria estremocensis]